MPAVFERPGGETVERAGQSGFRPWKFASSKRAAGLGRLWATAVCARRVPRDVGAPNARRSSTPSRHRFKQIGQFGDGGAVVVQNAASRQNVSAHGGSFGPIRS